MNVKAVIFDLDGTLLDTIDDLTDSQNQVLRENNYSEHSKEAYLYFIGNGARKLVERSLPEDKRDDISVDKYLNRWREVYREHWNKKTKLYDGVEELLLKLKSLRIPLAVLSNKSHGDVVRIMEYYFDDTTFSVIAGQKDHIPHKPAPDGVFLITEELKIKPEDCLFVGDSSVDMKTAKAAGMKAVGVSWGFRPVEELWENGADFIINNPLELLSLL